MKRSKIVLICIMVILVLGGITLILMKPDSETKKISKITTTTTMTTTTTLPTISTTTSTTTLKTTLVPSTKKPTKVTTTKATSKSTSASTKKTTTSTTTTTTTNITTKKTTTTTAKLECADANCAVCSESVMVCEKCKDGYNVDSLGVCVISLVDNEDNIDIYY